MTVGESSKVNLVEIGLFNVESITYLVDSFDPFYTNHMLTRSIFYPEYLNQGKKDIVTLSLAMDLVRGIQGYVQLDKVEVMSLVYQESLLETLKWLNQPSEIPYLFWAITMSIDDSARGKLRALQPHFTTYLKFYEPLYNKPV